MRRPVKNKRTVKPDFVYNSEKVGKLINYIMERGKKNVARKIVYDAFEIIKKETKSDALEVFENAIRNVGPATEIRSKRVGGANYQVPTEVRPERRLALTYRWIIAASTAKKGQPMAKKLANEIMMANKNEGEAVKKRETVHRMAEANRAFAHFGVSRKA